jgi:hypothetical protein
MSLLVQEVQKVTALAPLSHRTPPRGEDRKNQESASASIMHEVRREDLETPAEAVEAEKGPERDIQVPMHCYFLLLLAKRYH